MPRAKNPQGAKIRARRKELGLSQEDLATLAGMNRSDLSDIELDKDGVGPDRGPRLALALRWPLSELGLTPDDLDGHADEQLARIQEQIQATLREVEALRQELGEVRELVARTAGER